MSLERVSVCPYVHPSLYHTVYIWIIAHQIVMKFGHFYSIRIYVTDLFVLYAIRSALGLVVSRETQNLGVPYYVDKGFEKEYQGASLRELESTIETDYIDYLQTSCWKDKQQSKCVQE